MRKAERTEKRDGDGGGGRGARDLGSRCRGMQAWRGVVQRAVRCRDGRRPLVARLPGAQEGEHGDQAC